MINSVQNVNLYQPKKITIETKPFESIDEGMPYQGMKVEVAEEKDNGEKVVWADYALNQDTSQELENLKEVLSSIYAQEAYKPSKTSQEDYTPPIGKDGW